MEDERGEADQDRDRHQLTTSGYDGHDTTGESASEMRADDEGDQPEGRWANRLRVSSVNVGGTPGVWRMVEAIKAGEMKQELRRGPVSSKYTKSKFPKFKLYQAPITKAPIIQNFTIPIDKAY